MFAETHWLAASMSSSRWPVSAGAVAQRYRPLGPGLSSGLRSELRRDLVQSRDTGMPPVNPIRSQVRNPEMELRPVVTGSGSPRERRLVSLVMVASRPADLSVHRSPPFRWLIRELPSWLGSPVPTSAATSSKPDAPPRTSPPSIRSHRRQRTRSTPESSCRRDGASPAIADLPRGLRH